MTARRLSAVSLAAAIALSIWLLPHPALAGELRLTFHNGHVTLVAREVPVSEVLAEWERIGGTLIVNREAAPDTPVTLDLQDVPEARALAILLRQAAGYLASVRDLPAASASRFARIAVMPGEERLAAQAQSDPSRATPMTPTDAPAALPHVQQHIMPDGRVISVMAYPSRSAPTPAVPAPMRVPPADAQVEEPAEPPPVEAPAMMVMPVRGGPMPVEAGGNVGGVDAGAAIAGRPGASSDTAAGAPSPSAAARVPSVPVSVPTPGTYIPSPKPEPAPYTPGGAAPPPPPPVKPPG